MTNALRLEERDRLASLFGLIAVRAGEAIMQARAAAADTGTKSDGSPVTAADLKADEIIRQCLQRNLPHLPVITEETCSAASVVDADQFEAICAAWTKDPEAFIINPRHLIPGPNT